MNKALTILGIKTKDVRFPMSKPLDGSDAMYPDLDYSTTNVILKTNRNSVIL